MTEPGASSSERGAVLVLHGFTARPRTVEPLGAHLAAAGFTYAIPPLRGHGTHYRDLAAVNWQDWVEDGRNTFESLARHHSRVSIVGHSVGALVAAALAAGDPRVASLVLVAPAILYANPAVTLLPLLRRFVTEWPSGPDSINDPALRTAYAGTNYPRFPVRAFEQAFTLSRATPGNLRRVKCPALVVQSRLDRVIKPRSAEVAYASLGSDHKRLTWLQRSNHELFWDLERDQLAGLIVAFLKETA